MFLCWHPILLGSWMFNCLFFSVEVTVCWHWMMMIMMMIRYHRLFKVISYGTGFRIEGGMTITNIGNWSTLAHIELGHLHLQNNFITQIHSPVPHSCSMTFRCIAMGLALELGTHNPICSRYITRGVARATYQWNVAQMVQEVSLP